jgi:rhomboid protease GluP
MLGMTSALRALRESLALWPLLGWVCGALYIATLITDPDGMRAGAGLSLFAPSGERLLAFGASGARPVLLMHRWWTLFSAGWLHGDLIHIGMNMLWLRQLAPAVEELYGTGRAWVIYVLSGAAGFAASSLSAFAPWYLGWLGRPGTTVGASAALFGLLGALLHYSRRGGSRALGQTVWTWAIAAFVFGLLPGFRIDNWAHLGGFIGGWLLSYWLDPLRPERLDHLVAAVLCLLASAGAVIWSLATWR